MDAVGQLRRRLVPRIAKGPREVLKIEHPNQRIADRTRRPTISQAGVGVAARVLARIRGTDVRLRLASKGFDARVSLPAWARSSGVRRDVSQRRHAQLRRSTAYQRLWGDVADARAPPDRCDPRGRPRVTAGRVRLGRRTSARRGDVDRQYSTRLVADRLSPRLLLTRADLRQSSITSLNLEYRQELWNDRAGARHAAGVRAPAPTRGDERRRRPLFDGDCSIRRTRTSGGRSAARSRLDAYFGYCCSRDVRDRLPCATG